MINQSTRCESDSVHEKYANAQTLEHINIQALRTSSHCHLKEAVTDRHFVQGDSGLPKLQYLRPLYMIH